MNLKEPETAKSISEFEAILSIFDDKLKKMGILISSLIGKTKLIGNYHATGKEKNDELNKDLERNFITSINMKLIKFEELNNELNEVIDNLKIFVG